jgi:hypothetical protein
MGQFYALLHMVLFVRRKRLGRLCNSVETEKVVCVWGTLLPNFDPGKMEGCVC